jgi:hypothetical protein
MRFGLSRVLFFGGIQEICKSWLWKQAALSLGASWACGQGARFNGNSERQMKESSVKRASLFMAALKPGGWTLLRGTLKDMSKEGSGTSHLSP